MDRLRLGIIGWGPRGRGVSLGVVRAAASHLFDIVAAADPYECRRHDAQEQLGPEACVYPSHQELLQDPRIDAVLIFTGAQAFADISCAAMRAGKPVCADVPMAFTRQDVWDLVVTSEQTGIPFCMAEQVRFANFVVRWQEHIQRGDIGQVLFVQGEYIHPAIGFYYNHTMTGDSNYNTISEAVTNPDYAPTWRNTFVDPIKYIPHELSPLLKIINDRVATVSCLTTDVRSYGDAVQMLDCQCALMMTDQGRTLRIVNSFTAPNAGQWEHHWYHIMGTAGVLESARPHWGGGALNWLEQDLMLDKTGQVTYPNYGWARADTPFGDASMGHAGLEAFVMHGFYEAVTSGAADEFNVYTAMESILPGIVAAESAARGGTQLAVPEVRPNATRGTGSYPEES